MLSIVIGAAVDGYEGTCEVIECLTIGAGLSAANADGSFVGTEESCPEGDSEGDWLADGVMVGISDESVRCNSGEPVGVFDAGWTEGKFVKELMLGKSVDCVEGENTVPNEGHDSDDGSSVGSLV